MPTKWTPNSWRSKPIQQVPQYPDLDALSAVEKQLASYPPLVFAGEARALKKSLAAVSRGEAFIMQGGDCAESFAEHGADNIRDFFRVFLQMAVVLTFAAAKPVVKIGRIAGQFAKPRSSDFEKQGDVTLPSYRGDIINGIDFTPQSRIPDPERQIMAYRQSAATLNLLRAFAQGGYANLEHVHQWMLGFVENSPQSERYHQLANRLTETLRLHEGHRLCGGRSSQAARDRFLHQPRGAAAWLRGGDDARRFSTSGDWYATSGHMIWIGDRTRQPDHAHVEYCRGIKNPIGLKCGPSLTDDGLLNLIDILNPENEPGRLTLIARFGAGQGRRAPAASGARGAARGPQSGVDLRSDARQHDHAPAAATRRGRSTASCARCRSFFAVHRAEGTYPGGVHFEMTGKDVTECTGGARAVSDEDLADRYHTHCDPRLNANQALELAFLVSELLQEDRASVEQKAVVNG